jgi:hypothetical protein
MTALICGELGWESRDCQDYCADWYTHSNGCDADAEYPCQCEFDVIDGVTAGCAPGQFTCIDEHTASICIEHYYDWEEVDCEAYCQGYFGDQATSEGCDPEAETPCQCNVDGDIAPCTPGDFLFCPDPDTAAFCDDNGWHWDYWSCSGWCAVTYGQDSESSGCNDDGGDNFCSCQ